MSRTPPRIRGFRPHPRRTFLARIAAGVLAPTAALSLVAPEALAQAARPPIKIGFAVAQTGGLAAGGRSVLLAYQLWRDDINAKGGLLGRPVELVHYDDQSNPATTPGIYAKLMDVDKVDLLLSPYATNQIAPILPLVRERKRVLMGMFGFAVNDKLKYDRFFSISPFGAGHTDEWSRGFFEIVQENKWQNVAILAADAEFAQNAAGTARRWAQKMGLKVVFDRNYPPNTVEFGPLIRSIRAARPDAVYIASYPPESLAIMRSLGEVGVGDSVKIFGGGMVGVQNAVQLEALGSGLNGLVNYDTYVPEPTMSFPGVKEFLAKYQPRAKAEKLDPLGMFIPPFSYALMQVLAEGVQAAGSLDDEAIAKALHTRTFNTIVGQVKFDELGEWAKPRMLMIQYRGVRDRDIEQFYGPGKRVILYPKEFRTGDVVFPFEKARQAQ
jgi:branched-chain amino acid transport system substrate-binding protein